MVIIFLISLILIIFCHEFAHLIVAKKCGCGVDIFSIGFGRPLYRKEYKGTIYQISWILLGGFCKLTDELKVSNEPTAFTNLPYRKKLAIAFAGVTTNIIMGLIAIGLGKLFLCWTLLYFGLISVVLGITNILPLAPCLDGGYVIWMPIYIKVWGKEKGTIKFAIANRISFIILMTLNVLCIPYIIYIVKNGGL